jgi:hypothetical protein
MNSHRLARLSRQMAAVTLWLSIAMLLLNAACWFFPALTSAKGGYGLGFALTDRLISSLAVDVSALPWWQKTGGVVLSSVPLVALANGLAHLRLLFCTYGRREYFSVHASRHLAKVGRAIAVWAILSFLFEPLLSIWLTLREPIGQHVVTLSLSSADVVALFLAASIAIVARVLQQSSELHSEHRLFI